MVAEGPAVKTFEELQADLIAADIEIMERQLAIAARAGLIHGASEADILERVKVEAEPPIIKSENRLQEAQADQILLLSGVMSKESMAARHGLVYADERDKMGIESAGNSGAGNASGQLSTQNSVPSTQPPGADPQSPASSPRPLPQGLQEYSDDQLRDDYGRWTVGGGVGVAGGDPQSDIQGDGRDDKPVPPSNPAHPTKPAWASTEAEKKIAALLNRHLEDIETIRKAKKDDPRLLFWKFSGKSSRNC